MRSKVFKLSVDTTLLAIFYVPIIYLIQHQINWLAYIITIFTFGIVRGFSYWMRRP